VLVDIFLDVLLGVATLRPFFVTVQSCDCIRHVECLTVLTLTQNEAYSSGELAIHEKVLFSFQ